MKVKIFQMPGGGIWFGNKNYLESVELDTDRDLDSNTVAGCVLREVLASYFRSDVRCDKLLCLSDLSPGGDRG